MTMKKELQVLTVDGIYRVRAIGCASCNRGIDVLRFEPTNGNPNPAQELTGDLAACVYDYFASLRGSTI